MSQPSQQKIEEQLSLAQETELDTRWPAMTYEQGVANALMRVTGQSTDAPMED